MLNILKKNKNIIIIFWVLYLLLAPTTVVSAGFMRFFPTLALILISIFGLISWSGSRKVRMNTIVTCFVLFIIFNALVTESAYGNIFITLIRSTYWIWLYFLSFVFFKDECPDSPKYQKSIVLISIVMISAFYISHRLHITEIGDENGDNTIFYSLMLIPWISLIHNIRLKWVIIVLLSLCVLLSLKRSSTIIMVCCVAIIYYSDFLHNKKLKVSTIFTGFLIVILFVGALFVVSDQTAMVIQRFESIEDDGGNGRAEIYDDVYRRYISSTPDQQIIGHGFDAVRRDSSFFIPLSAHNDFLEVLYDFGIIGLLLYVLIHFSLIKWTIRLFRTGSQLAFPALISYVCFFVMSMVSHLILYPTYFGLITAFWAYAECKDRELRLSIRK